MTGINWIDTTFAATIPVVLTIWHCVVQWKAGAEGRMTGKVLEPDRGFVTGARKSISEVSISCQIGMKLSSSAGTTTWTCPGREPPAARPPVGVQLDRVPRHTFLAWPIQPESSISADSKVQLRVNHLGHSTSTTPLCRPISHLSFGKQESDPCRAAPVESHLTTAASSRSVHQISYRIVISQHGSGCDGPYIVLVHTAYVGTVVRALDIVHTC